MWATPKDVALCANVLTTARFCDILMPRKVVLICACSDLLGNVYFPFLCKHINKKLKFLHFYILTILFYMIISYKFLCAILFYLLYKMNLCCSVIIKKKLEVYGEKI